MQILKDLSGLPLNQREFGENAITYFSLNKITEIVLSFHVTHIRTCSSVPRETKMLVLLT